MWASVRCLFKMSTLYSWLCYKGRACRMTSSLLRDRLDWTMGTVDLRPHRYCLHLVPRWSLDTGQSLFLKHKSLLSPKLSHPFSEHSSQWVNQKTHHRFSKLDPAEMGHLFICMLGTWFCQLYAVYKKPLLSAFPVLWGMHMNNFKWGKCCWEYCFIWEF